MKKYLILFVTVLSSFITVSCQQKKEGKIKGMSFVATRNPITDAAVLPVKTRYNATYAAVIPYGYMRSLDSPEIFYNTERQWWGEQIEGARETIELFKKQGTKVMLKPQIWIGGGDYTGNISMLNDQKWELLEKSYTKFIMDYAYLAAETDVALLCIGTELDSFVVEQPEYWTQLIDKIRKVYKGKITYAGNWDSYKNVGFWNQLDYIGVDAYFPVSTAKTPSLERVMASWEAWKKEMAELSEQFDRPILFTEYGYISADYAGREPWKNAGKDRGVNYEAQSILFEGLFKTVWQEEWLAGGFIWKHHADTSWGGYEKLFTAQDKPAQEVVARYYKLPH